MSKRSIDDEGVAETSKRGADFTADRTESDENGFGMEIEGEIEDLSGDDYDSEGEIIEIDTSGGEDEDEDMDGDIPSKAQRQIEENERQAEEQEKGGQELYLPHKSKPLGPDEYLEADPTVYDMLHNVGVNWPCLTLDILPDDLGNERRNYPATMYITTATQAQHAKDNQLLTMKVSSLRKTLVKEEQEEDEEDDEDDEDYVDPVLEHESIPLKSTTNRIRVSPHSRNTGEYFTATMLENGEVSIFDLSAQYKAFNTPGFTIPKQSKRPLHIIKHHGNVEGYGLDWSPLISTGALLSGDVSGRIYLTNRNGSKWITDKNPFQVNNESIEDIKWSPSENTVFATGGVDGYMRIWDTRTKKHKPAISVQASKSDVNVISWCSKVDRLLASGHDDGSWSVWDLRLFKDPKTAPDPVVSYDFHKAPITSISFNPLDESILAVSSEDHTVTLWDLAVEADDEEVKQQMAETQELNDIPAQLLFVHWQKDVKDVAWHKQIPGALVSTGSSGINIWKTISV